MPYRLYVFGSNGEGQLGIPAADIVHVPTEVPDPPALKSVRAIRCGDNHTLLQTNDGTLYGVGDNRKSQLAPRVDDKTRFDRFEPLQKSGTFVAATCETSACISIDNVMAQSWIDTEGTAQWGELGRGNDITSTTGPLRLSSHIFGPLPGTVIDFAAGVWHYVAILGEGSVYGWGKARLGQLGSNLTDKVTVPTQIKDIPFKPKKVICGKDCTYVVGDPSTGEHILLGKDKFGIVSNMPQNIKGWKDIGATWHAIFVLFEDGTLTAWGKDNMWQLLPPNLPPLQKIAVGSDHVLAVTHAGKLISWGWGKHGNCGDLSSIGREIKNDMVSGFWNEIHVPGNIEMIAAGYCTSFVVTK
jgi:protein ATS1